MIGLGEAATETSAPASAPAPTSAPVSNNNDNNGLGETTPSVPADNGWGEAGASNGGNGANNNDGWFDAPVPSSSRPPKKEVSDIQLQDDTEGLITSTFQVEASNLVLAIILWLIRYTRSNLPIFKVTPTLPFTLSNLSSSLTCKLTNPFFFYPGAKLIRFDSHEDLMKGIIAAGFQKPSKIQEKALPLLLSNP